MRVYIETTVWSFAFAEDSPDYTRSTLRFFERVRSGVITPVISISVLREVERADQPVRERLAGLLSEINPMVIEQGPGVESLAREFLRLGAVPPSKPEDAAHVASAFVGSVGVLVSWNFKHIANFRRAERFNQIAATLGYARALMIVSPSELQYGTEET